MLDINMFRADKGGDPEIIRESQRRRYADVGLVDKVLEFDEQWRKAYHALGQVRAEFGALNKEIATLRKAKQDATELQEKSKTIKARIADAEKLEKELAEARDAAIIPIGNIVHDSVPVSDDEANNVVVKEFGTKASKEEKPYNHVDLVALLDIVNMEQGSEVAGGRGYYLVGAGALLNQAIIATGMAFLYKKNYTPVQTPFFMRQSIMGECAQLSQFDEELYKVTGEGEDKYLIATSEQTLCAMHRKQWFEEAQLPKRYAGYSTCFRKEVGAHGRDTLGIFRVHQFEKVEQFVVCSSRGGQSWKLMDEMLANSEEFYQALGLPYQVINIVSGELNDAAAKKYDLEAWFPASQTHRELVSCSNCTDYQSRRLEVRERSKAGPNKEESKKEYVHLLNSTLTATSRTLCCILENYQTPEGVVVPELLRPFMCGLEFLPFKKMFDKKGKLVDRPAPTPASSDMSTS